MSKPLVEATTDQNIFASGAFIESKDDDEDIRRPRSSWDVGVPAFRPRVTIVEKETPRLVVLSENLARFAYSLKGKVCIWSLTPDLEKENEILLKDEGDVVAMSF